MFLNSSRSESQAEHRNGKTLNIPKVLSPQKQVNTQTMNKLGRDKTVVLNQHGRRICVSNTSLKICVEFTDARCLKPSNHTQNKCFSY